MKVIVKGRHFKLTTALREHAEQKLLNALTHVYDRPAAKMEIELSDVGAIRSGANKECRVRVIIPKGKVINICEVDDNMYKAIDLAHDRLLIQINRERGRRDQTSKARKAAVREREQIAKRQLTAAPEIWERELRAYENSQPHI